MNSSNLRNLKKEGSLRNLGNSLKPIHRARQYCRECKELLLKGWSGGGGGRGVSLSLILSLSYSVSIGRDFVLF